MAKMNGDSYYVAQSHVAQRHQDENQLLMYNNKEA